MTILVGSPPTEFSVHEKILMTSESEFFNNGFQETQTGILKLPEDDAESFQLFLHWTYGNATSHVGAEKAFFKGVPPSALLKLYALAFKYMLESLQDATVKLMWWHALSRTWTEMCFTQDAMEYFEATTMEGCLMDNLLVDWMAQGALDGIHFHSEKIEDAIIEIIPQRLLRAVFRKITNRYLDGFEPGDFMDIGTVDAYLLHPTDDVCP